MQLSTSIIIPNSATKIGSGAFEGSGLTSIMIPGGVTSIGSSAFQDCENLTSVTIANGLRDIGPEPSIFFGCASLTNVTIPNTVTNIVGSAFQNCTSLAKIVIPDSVSSIGTWAFDQCTNLTSAYFQGNAPPDNGNAFSSDPATIVYYLPGTIGWGATFGGAPTELWNPQATTFTTAGNQFGFSITGPANATIVVEACTNLANPIWVPISTSTLSGSGVGSFGDPQGANYPRRFYRFSAP